jgi:DNA-binding NarL/FixJ family response regulator
MKALIVDDHALVRHGLSLALAEVYPGVDVVEAASADDAIGRITENGGFDLVLLDLAMHGMNAFDGLDLFAEQMPGTPVVIVSASESYSDIRKAFQHGAKGYVFKSSAAEVLRAALPLVMSGEVYVPGAVIGAAGIVATGDAGDECADALGEEPAKALTPRQQEVLAHLAKGESNKEIARNLGMLDGTVKVHVKAILKKLGVHNRTQAVITGVRLGHLPPSILD